MPEKFLLVLVRHGRHTLPSPHSMRMIKYALFYNWIMLHMQISACYGVNALFGRMLGQPPPEHFSIIIAALPVDLPAVLNDQEGGRSNDWRLQ